MDSAKTISALTQNLKKCSWVLFKNNSFVLVKGPLTDDAVEKSIKTMKEMGPVFVGTPHGDFNVMSLSGDAGWVVTSHCSELMTFVGPDEITDPDDLKIGLYGRSNRDKDSKDPVVVHKYMWSEAEEQQDA